MRYIIKLLVGFTKWLELLGRAKGRGIAVGNCLGMSVVLASGYS